MAFPSTDVIAYSLRSEITNIEKQLQDLESHLASLNASYCVRLIRGTELARVQQSTRKVREAVTKLSHFKNQLGQVHAFRSWEDIVPTNFRDVDPNAWGYGSFEKLRDYVQVWNRRLEYYNPAEWPRLVEKHRREIDEQLEERERSRREREYS
ncbi:hypothetical protein BU23DRAFT_572254 [Bimuria novae-zelandiae CBS 107.79]|uniref:Uncharacterized protein n=1 Tax=Bimuria novae-zelandiae CBS 107.79 TaxID=1447943 RepID=A0A6A5V5A0_9PLEO|nr:hypothetical protein BU23DRAFT_572254 [Bimuria novae-zelandiae CBS 107.79]